MIPHNSKQRERERERGKGAEIGLKNVVRVEEKKVRVEHCNKDKFLFV